LGFKACTKLVQLFSCSCFALIFIRCLYCSNEAAIKTTDMKNTVTPNRRKDIRTIRKEMKATGFQNIKFNT